MKINTNIRKKAGFTLVELLVYTALVGVFLSGATLFTIDILSGREKTERQQNLTDNARLVLTNITSQLHNATSIVSVSNERLEFLDSAEKNTIMSLINNSIVLTQDGINNPLTNNQIVVSSLNFTNLSSINSSNIKVQFTITDNELTKTYETTVEIRKRK